MRPALGVYGVNGTSTPHMDALGRSGTVFTRAFCQIAWCAPSRNSFLTGLRPSQTRTYNFLDSFREPSAPSTNATTLPELFKRAGFTTLSFGKVFHPDLPAAFDYPRSWSEPPIMPIKPECADGGMACELPANHPLTADANTTRLALAALDRLQRQEQRLEQRQEQRRQWQWRNRTLWFVAVGYQAPRLPWSYPAEAAARLPAASALPIATHRDAPADATQPEWFRPTEVDRYTGVAATREAPLVASTQHKLRRAYYAAITHIDDQVGALLAKVDGYAYSADAGADTAECRRCH